MAKPDSDMGHCTPLMLPLCEILLSVSLLYLFSVLMCASVEIKGQLEGLGSFLPYCFPRD